MSVKFTEWLVCSSIPFPTTPLGFRMGPGVTFLGATSLAVVTVVTFRFSDYYGCMLACSCPARVFSEHRLN